MPLHAGLDRSIDVPFRLDARIEKRCLKTLVIGKTECQICICSGFGADCQFLMCCRCSKPESWP